MRHTTASNTSPSTQSTTRSTPLPSSLGRPAGPQLHAPAVSPSAAEIFTSLPSASPKLKILYSDPPHQPCFSSPHPQTSAPSLHQTYQHNSPAHLEPLRAPSLLKHNQPHQIPHRQNPHPVFPQRLLRNPSHKFHAPNIEDPDFQWRCTSQRSAKLLSACV